MPWGWKRSTPETRSSLADIEVRYVSEGSPAIPKDEVAERPLSSGFRFRIDGVYTVTGMGCVAVGELVEGSMTFPTEARVVPGPGSKTPRGTVTAVSAELKGNPLSELHPGQMAAVVIKGAAPKVRFGATVGFALHKGDSLVGT